MAIILDDLKPKSSKPVTRNIEYGDVTLTIEYSGDKGFQNAYSRLQEIEAEEKSEDDYTALSRKRNTGERLSSVERQIYILGEFLIKDWSGIETKDGDKPEINGKNLISLCANISDDDNEKVEFITKVFESLTEVMNEFKEKNEVAKKKPLKSTTTRKKQAS